MTVLLFGLTKYGLSKALINEPTHLGVLGKFVCILSESLPSEYCECP